MRLDDSNRKNLWVDRLLQKTVPHDQPKYSRNYAVVVLVMLIFMTISVITNIWGALIPDVQASFNLSMSLVGFIPTFLFLAYGFSLPIGMLAEKYSAKPILIIALSCSFLGCFLLAVRPTYIMALLSLFTIGMGFSMAQVVINPLLRVSGGEENYAFFGSMSQFVFAFGSAASPQLYAYLRSKLIIDPFSESSLHSAQDVGVSIPWVAIYWVFCAMLILCIIATLIARIPNVEFNPEEKVGSFTTAGKLLKLPKVWFYFTGIFCYVAVEQGVSSWISSYLQNYHKVDPTDAARTAVSGFWGVMALGCVANLILLKIFDSRKILFVFMVFGLVTLLAALLGGRSIAMMGLPLMGFWLAPGWPLVFSLALNSIDKHHGTFAGILCTGIIGGAIMIPIVGRVGDIAGLKVGILFNALPMIYLIILSLKARPIIQNSVIKLSRTEILVERTEC